ncbi:MAG: sensor domain-containing diguanylate cyclase [Candidatus Zixiibacteriota bacterium]
MANGLFGPGAGDWRLWRSGFREQRRVFRFAPMATMVGVVCRTSAEAEPSLLARNAMRMAASHLQPSVLPRGDQPFWVLRTLPLGTLLFSFASGGQPTLGGTAGWALAGLYAAVFAVPGALVWWRGWRFPSYFWPLFLVDTIAIAALVHMTGGPDSSYFVLYYALVPFVAFHMRIGSGLIAAGLVTVAYVGVCIGHSGVGRLPDVAFRTIILWALTTALGLAGRFAGVFAGRLLNAMDKLNERTSELERTHAQLETIYETSRSLAELMSVDNVIQRVLTIANRVLNYPVCEILTWHQSTRDFRLQGRVEGGCTQQFRNPQAVELNDVFRQAIATAQAVRIVDHYTGRVVLDGTARRSQLVVPMVSEGRVVGLLNAESPRARAFSEHDQRVLSVLAASTAMALVNADLHRRMEELIIIDELTGVYNYRYFCTRLEDEKRRAARYGQPLSLIMVDIDWFKELNDRHGHQAGNLALRRMAWTIGACIRDVDILARYGGEEFMIILPQTGVREAKAIAERIRGQIEKTEFGADATGCPIHLTVSLGISCYPENGLPEDALVDSVDQALYRAKGAGKNAVAVSTS